MLYFVELIDKTPLGITYIIVFIFLSLRVRINYLCQDEKDSPKIFMI